MFDGNVNFCNLSVDFFKFLRFIECDLFKMTLFFDFLRCEGLFESFLFDVEGDIVGLDDLFDFHVRKVFGSLLEVV